MKRSAVLVIFSIFLMLTMTAFASCGYLTVRITYDANGGSFSNGSETLVLEKSSGALLVEPVSPSKAGSIFVGWSTSEDGSSLWNFATDRPHINTTLYAVWHTAEAKLISLTDGETVDNEIRLSISLAAERLDFSDMVTVSDYASWILCRDSAGDDVISDKVLTDIPVGESTYYIVVTAKDGALSETYTLKITRENTVSVTLDASEGVLEDVDAEALIVYGENFALPVPTRTGYTFLGWILDNALITDASGASIAESDITDSVTLVASWEKELYTVTVSSEKTAAGSVSGGGQYGFGDTVAVNATANAGYRFAGWYDGNNVLVSSAPSYSFVAIGNVSLTAKFERSQSGNVDNNGWTGS